VLTATENGVAQLWHWSIEQSSQLSLEHGSAITSANVDLVAKRLTTAGVLDGVKVWDLPGGRLVLSVPDERRVTQSLLSEDGANLVTLTKGGVIHFRPAGAEGVATRELRDETPVKHIALSRDQTRLLAVGDHGATLWDPAEGLQIGGALDPDRQMRFGAFSPDGKYFVTGAADGTAQIREAEGARAIGKIIHQKGIVDSAAFSPNGKQLVTAAVDQSYSPLGASIWDVETGLRLAGPLMHRDGVHLVDFSPDGRLVATAGEDAIVLIWDAASGRPMAPPIVQSTRVTAFAFSPDSRMLATGNFGGVARVWSADTGKPLTPPLTHADRVVLVHFLPKEKGLLVVSSDGKARIWSLAPEDESNERLTDRARILSSHRFDLEAGLVPLDRASISNTWHRLRPE
jgi:WD40 repeat protein